MKNAAIKELEFYKNFIDKIAPTLRKYETERKIRVFVFVILYLSFFAVSIYFLFLSRLFPQKIYFIGFGYVLLLGLLSYLSFILKKHFENKVKKKIMPFVCSCYEDLRWYKGTDCKEMDLIQGNCLVPTYTKKKYDDVFSGCYKGVCFTMAEAKLYGRVKDSDEANFKGVIIRLEMNKNFTGHTVIKSCTVFHKSPAKHLKHTVLEDINFEKNFDVFTNDEIEARYLITPSFMERLFYLKTIFCAEGLSCAFYKKNLYIALPVEKDLFSLCSFMHPTDDFNQYETMHKEIGSILKLIDYLKLNEKTGL